jgi:hypothetical protein
MRGHERQVTLTGVVGSSGQANTPVSVGNACTFPCVPSPKSLTDSEVERVKEALRDLVREHGGQAAVQRLLGLKQRTLSKYLSGAGLPGIHFAEQVALARGLNRFALRDGYSPPPPSTVEYDPRYPHFVEAARAESDLVSQAVRETFALLKHEGDLEVHEWREQIRSKAREIGARARFPVEAGREAEASRLAADARRHELLREHAARPSIEERARAALSLHPAPEPPPRRVMQPSSEPPAEGPTEKPKK